jgi:hypothetical protein
MKPHGGARPELIQPSRRVRCGSKHIQCRQPTTTRSVSNAPLPDAVTGADQRGARMIVRSTDAARMPKRSQRVRMVFDDLAQANRSQPRQRAEKHRPDDKGASSVPAAIWKSHTSCRTHGRCVASSSLKAREPSARRSSSPGPNRWPDAAFRAMLGEQKNRSHGRHQRRARRAGSETIPNSLAQCPRLLRRSVVTVVLRPERLPI